MERIILAICIGIFALFILVDFFSHEKIEAFSNFLFDQNNLFADMRVDYNDFSDKMDFAGKMNKGQKESMENTFFSPIYKREYDELITLYKLDNLLELEESFTICTLLNTVGDINSEILRIKSDKPISTKGFIVSARYSTVVGKIIKSYGNTADVAPFWSNRFSSQVYVSSKNEIEGINNDLALIEKRTLINFNPALPYDAGDEIRIAGTEFGGYNLERYNMNRIGTVSDIKSTEIVEKYEINYNFSRSNILDNRYFFILENLK